MVLLEMIETIGKMLNGYIKSIGNVSEPYEEYGQSSHTDVKTTD
jgi:hypothetical protein